MDSGVVQELERLAGELQAGRISQEEFDRARAALVEGGVQPEAVSPAAPEVRPEPPVQPVQPVAAPQQPVYVPQPQPQYQAPQAPYPRPARRAINYAPLIIVAIVFAGLTGWFLATAGSEGSKSEEPKSNLKVAGKQLSEAEAEEAVNELERMFANAKPGDLDSIDFSIKPKTELAKQFKALLQEGVENDKELTRQLAGRSLDQLIDLDRVSTPKDRRKAREDFVVCREALRAYRRKSAGIADKTHEWMKQVAGREVPVARTLREDMHRLSALDEKMYSDIDAFLTFCEDKAIKKARSGKVELPDADYDKIIKLSNAAIDSLNTMVQEDDEATRRRAAMSAESFPRLKRLFQSPTP